MIASLPDALIGFSNGLTMGLSEAMGLMPLKFSATVFPVTANNDDDHGQIQYY